MWPSICHRNSSGRRWCLRSLLVGGGFSWHGPLHIQLTQSGFEGSSIDCSGGRRAPQASHVITLTTMLHSLVCH